MTRKGGREGGRKGVRTDRQDPHRSSKSDVTHLFLVVSSAVKEGLGDELDEARGHLREGRERGRKGEEEKWLEEREGGREERRTCSSRETMTSPIARAAIGLLLD